MADQKSQSGDALTGGDDSLQSTAALVHVASSSPAEMDAAADRQGDQAEAGSPLPQEEDCVKGCGAAAKGEVVLSEAVAGEEEDAAVLVRKDTLPSFASSSNTFAIDRKASPFSKEAWQSSMDDIQETLDGWDRRWLIFPKVIYFTVNCAIYSTHNFSAMYFLKEWKLQAHQYGIVSSLTALQLVGALFWAHIADRTGRHKSVLLMCTFFYALFFCLLGVKLFQDDATMTRSIAYSATMLGCSSFFVASMFPLVDAQIFSMLARESSFTKAKFGRQRLWGTIGHGVITVILGMAIDAFGNPAMFAVLVISCAIFMLVVLFAIPSDVRIIKKVIRKKSVAPPSAAAGLHAAPLGGEANAKGHEMVEKATATGDGESVVDCAAIKASQEMAAVSECGSPRGGAPEAAVSLLARISRSPAVVLLLNPHFMFLLFVILAAGYIRSVMSIFLALYMQKDLHKSATLVAIAILFRMASEIAIFFYNKQLMHTIGLHWLLIIAQVAGLVRIYAYSVLPSDGNWFYLSFLIELLKGTSTGCLVSAGAHMSNNIAPEGCVATAQAYFSGIYSGISPALGGALGGHILYTFPEQGIPGLFNVSFYIGLAPLILSVIKYALVDGAIIVPNARARRLTS